jgi:hypothetical protein
MSFLSNKSTAVHTNGKSTQNKQLHGQPAMQHESNIGWTWVIGIKPTACCIPAMQHESNIGWTWVIGIKPTACCITLSALHNSVSSSPKQNNKTKT